MDGHLFSITVFLFSPEEKIKILEKKVNDLIEESCLAHARGDLQLVGLAAISGFEELTFGCRIIFFLQSLEKAKEAGRKERALVRQREQTGTADHINLDLTYSVSSLLHIKFTS